ncbi:MAG TPA: AzlD domain-containing protein [Nocardioides sp.]|nr:AzlD domain-containing protein [Nocardioides sp.]
MSSLLAILAVGLGTFVSRAAFIVALARRTVPERVVRALDQVAPATLAALVAALLVGDGHGGPGLPELGGLAVAALVGLRWRNLIVILAAGMTAYWLLGWAA